MKSHWIHFFAFEVLGYTDIVRFLDFFRVSSVLSPFIYGIINCNNVDSIAILILRVFVKVLCRTWRLISQR